MRDLPTGNKLCRISLSGLIAMTSWGNWRICRSRSMIWRLSLEDGTVEEAERIHLMTPTMLRMGHLRVMACIDRETDRVKLWGIIMDPPIARGTDIVMPFYMQWVEHWGELPGHRSSMKSSAQRCRDSSRPPFTIYDRKADPVEHVSHYIPMMSLYSHNDRLMCKVFSSSLRLTTMRWFNSLRKWSI